MSELIPYQSRYLVPKDNTTVSLAYLITPNELDYEGEAAIALTSEALWVCSPNGNHDSIHFQSIRDVDVRDFRGMTFEKYDGDNRTIVNPRDAWGVTVKHQRLGNFLYTLSFMTFFADNAYQWQRKIQQAIGRYDKEVSNGLLKKAGDGNGT